MFPMLRPGILLVETSLEGSLVPEGERRTLLDSFRGLQNTIDVGIHLYYERVQDVRGLKHALGQCTEQNLQGRTIRDDLRTSPRTAIRYVHVSGHGNTDSLEIPADLARGVLATPQQLVNAFASLKGSEVRAVVLSACDTGKNAELAVEIIRHSEVKAVVAYPEAAYDHICALAEQLLYYQLLRRRKLPVWEAVRRVNDALVLLGERENRLMACWSREKGEIEGPCPWWFSDEAPGRTSRSFISTLRTLVPRAGPVGEAELKLIRRIVRSLE
jgi:hypothetical protein